MGTWVRAPTLRLVSGEGVLMAAEAEANRKPDVDYDAIALSYAADRGASPVVVEEIVRGFSRAEIGSLLEMGCGTGDYLETLARQLGVRGFGLDRSLGGSAPASSQ